MKKLLLLVGLFSVMSVLSYSIGNDKNKKACTCKDSTGVVIDLDTAHVDSISMKGATSGNGKNAL